MTTPAQPDPAAEMRAAVALLREHAAVATPGPWTVNDPAYATEIHGPSRVAVVAGGRWGGEAPVFECDGDAAWIALMHPGVGTLLAEWLETTADYYRPGVTHPTHVVRALAVARALLGGAQ